MVDIRILRTVVVAVALAMALVLAWAMSAPALSHRADAGHWTVSAG